MTKRSAITMAAGLALALLVGVAAISLTLGAGAAANAGGHRKPKIEHRTQTVTIHKKASSTPAQTRLVHLAPTSAPSVARTASSGGYDDSESETFDDSSAEGAGSPAGSGAAEAGDD
jgi:hypothetical protein